MRERLIELLEDTLQEWECDVSKRTISQIAEHLLENGVIVPPCKVGDTVYVPWRWKGEQGVATIKVDELNFYDNKNHCAFFIDLESDDEDFEQSYGGWKTEKSIGETVFLTKEEAEKALKGDAE